MHYIRMLVRIEILYGEIWVIINSMFSDFMPKRSNQKGNF